MIHRGGGRGSRVKSLLGHILIGCWMACQQQHLRTHIGTQHALSAPHKRRPETVTLDQEQEKMTGISLAISLTLLISPTILILASGEPTDLIGYQDEKQQWILGGLSLIRRIDCTHVTSINPQECAKIRIAPASRFVAYVASLEQVESGHLQMTHPDLQDDIVETRDGNLTGILVLDPLADRAFGHPLFIFRIFTFNGNREERLRQCLDKRGLMYSR